MSDSMFDFGLVEATQKPAHWALADELAEIIGAHLNAARSDPRVSPAQLLVGVLMALDGLFESMAPPNGRWGPILLQFRRMTRKSLRELLLAGDRAVVKADQ